MKNIIAKLKNLLSHIKIKYVGGALIIVAGIGGGYFTARLTEEEKQLIVEAEYSIELAENSKEALIENEKGEIEAIDAVTIEAVDAGLDMECPEGEDCGQGAFIWADVSSPTAFKNTTYGKCLDTDGYYGAQCWDLGDVFWQNYAGRRLSTCGTGAARGIWNCKEQNAGSDFVLITDKTKLQAGDWVIFNSGKYGHVGMAMGGYNNGYVTLLGQNQGGASCKGGGAATNIVNINLSSFLGAFRPKSYEKKPDPVQPVNPVQPVSKCSERNVVKGDTLGKIMKECEGRIDWSKMNDYAKTWYSVKVKPNQTIYEGWNSNTGVGLYAGDIIKRKD